MTRVPRMIRFVYMASFFVGKTKRKRKKRKRKRKSTSTILDNRLSNNVEVDFLFRFLRREISHQIFVLPGETDRYRIRQVVIILVR